MQVEPGNVVYIKDWFKKFYMVKSIKVVVEDAYGKEFVFDKDQLLYAESIDFYKEQIEVLKAQVLNLQKKQHDITYQAN